MLEKIKIKIWKCWAVIVSVPYFILAIVIDLLNTGLAVLSGLLVGIYIILLDGFNRSEEYRNDLTVTTAKPIFDAYEMQAEIVTKIIKKIAGL